MSLFSQFMKFADDTIMGEFDYIRMCPEVAGSIELESYLDKYNLAISSLVSGLEKDRLSSDLTSNIADVKRKGEEKEVAICGLLPNKSSIPTNRNKGQKPFEQTEEHNELQLPESIKTSNQFAKY